MPMYNLLEYIDNYSDISRSLWHFKRDELPVTNAGYPENVTRDNSTTFKYKSSTLGNPAAVANKGVLKSAKIAVSLKYPSNSWRQSDMLFISCKFHLEMRWTKDCVVSRVAGNTNFKIAIT